MEQLKGIGVSEGIGLGPALVAIHRDVAAADRADRDAAHRPVQLVAGGTGVSPFLAMLDHHRRLDSPTRMQLLYSARTHDDVLARDLLGPETTVTLTRGAPAGWQGETGRIDADMLVRRGVPTVLTEDGRTHWGMGGVERLLADEPLVPRARG